MTATATAPAVRLRLGRDTRRLVLLVHLVCSLGWLGADVVLGVLAVTAFTSADPSVVASSYTALRTFAVPVLLTLGLGSLGSGVLLGLASRWGVVRTRWVLVKLVINVVLVTLVPVLLQPQVAEVATLVRAADPVLAADLGRGPIDLLFPAFVSGAALLVATVLAIWKPWGPTRRRTTGASNTSRPRPR
ncbi:hypothetical protein [Geodermatophilus sabuli]|uniref:DUF2269 domain-containing protein n=1 Tax=Geodermatophilus sabuli TaxID=1564158 RepID=A0A285EF35_9ACTN|nr:hypothetical protein [Geodermatophilus sabuli]MBB3083593.1 hypothetical protein [Geodermatophilus sabuli]SNX96686.1 hypothetical protein SAMN06893097_10520 [Geodermatophilus sabuli]